MKKKYRYFVSYTWSDKKGSGFGRSDVTTTTKMDLQMIDQIEQKLIEKDGFVDVSVLWWKRVD